MKALRLSVLTLGALALLDRPTHASECGSDAVQVGSLCVDEYEASVWEIAPTSTGLIKDVQKGKIRDATDLAAATRRGETADDYGAGCPDTGNGCKNFYAVSIPGVKPSANLTWFQAAAACRNANKRLPTTAEWQAAAFGTPDPGTDNGTTDCNITAATGVVNTGSRNRCRSNAEAFDMVGNLSEWVADWGEQATGSTTWPAAFGSDRSTMGGDGSAHLPGVPLRGGDYASGVFAGVFDVLASTLPHSWLPFAGFRCVRELRGTPIPAPPPNADPKCRQDAVRVGPLCVDKYEASVWEIAPALKGVVNAVQHGAIKTAGQLAGKAVRHGAQVDDYGDNCPDTGNGCKNFYAVSVPAVVPSANLTWFQAAAACRNSRKRLLTNAEWQVAALGTPDPGTDNGTTNCNVNSTLAVVNTGSRNLCVSDTGAFDMVGNLDEWVADWSDFATGSTNWPAAYGNDTSGVGGDGTIKLPGAFSRGGYFTMGANAGVFAVETGNTPASNNFATGFRCARRPSFQ